MRKKRVFIPKIENFGKTLTVPEVPTVYRSKLWREIKVETKLTLAEDVNNALDMLCLHFGLSRGQVVTHAINLLWKEVLETIEPDRIKLYEDKIHAVRMYRTERIERQQQHQLANVEPSNTASKEDEMGQVWEYNHKKRLKSF